MTTFTRVGVVTGANKGIGYAIVRQLALQYPSSPLNNGPLLICMSNLTARDPTRGNSALSALHSDPALKQAKALNADGGLTTIHFHPFDVLDPSPLCTHLQSTHPQGIDFFINNAGIALDGFSAELVQRTLETNYSATISSCRTFLPLLKPQGGRMVNLASSAGTLGRYSPSLRARFLAAARTGALADVDALMAEFVAAVQRGAEKEEGWPSAGYAVSKAGLIAGGKVLGREVASGGRQLYSVDPGYVNTDMSKGNGTRTPDEGADTSVKLALGVVGDEGRGAFWRDGGEVEW